MTDPARIARALERLAAGVPIERLAFDERGAAVAALKRLSAALRSVGATRRYDPATVALALQLREDGMPVATIARKLEVPRSTVRGWLRDIP